MARQSNTPHFFKDGQPIHRTAYCAFLDILGFSDRITRSYALGTQDELLAEFHSILGKAIVRLQRASQGTTLYFKSFTDNVILAQSQFSDDLESEFAFILWALREYQFSMACAGFFVRGGLSIGPLFIDENSVYGTALLEAYNLESKVAVNPVVVLSDAVTELVDKHVMYYLDKDAPQTSALLRGPDGRYFVDYLAEAIYETNRGEQLAGAELQKHKQNLLTELGLHRRHPGVFSKFAWLAAYHNHFCERVAHLPGYDESLKIPSSDFSLSFTAIASGET